MRSTLRRRDFSNVCLIWRRQCEKCKAGGHCVVDLFCCQTFCSNYFLLELPPSRHVSQRTPVLLLSSTPARCRALVPPLLRVAHQSAARYEFGQALVPKPVHGTVCFPPPNKAPHRYGSRLRCPPAARRKLSLCPWVMPALPDGLSDIPGIRHTFLCRTGPSHVKLQG